MFIVTQAQALNKHKTLKYFIESLSLFSLLRGISETDDIINIVRRYVMHYICGFKSL